MLYGDQIGIVDIISTSKLDYLKNNIQTKMDTLTDTQLTCARLLDRERTHALNRRFTKVENCS